ncbi:MAG TPA: FkbM family methyltransferase [Thermoanaerobaculia bacterium]|nr:FkbM family methyltransferase [Thermoanaerobaculia bacterium]
MTGLTGFRSPYRIARRFRHLPGIVRGVRSWPRFMWHYALGTVPRRPYVFRGGARLQLGRAVEHVAVLEVFLHGDYGPIADGWRILDIGASVGVFTVYAVTRARGVRVEAFEPCPESYSVLLANVAGNGAQGRVTCHRLAVAGRRGPASLSRGTSRFVFPTLVEDPSSLAGERVEVDCTTLDDVLAGGHSAVVDLLKMDCEGSEYDILYRASPTALQRLREIRMEYHQLDGASRNGEALAAYLTAVGFTVTRLVPASPEGGLLWACRPPERLS